MPWQILVGLTLLAVLALAFLPLARYRLAALTLLLWGLRLALAAGLVTCALALVFPAVVPESAAAALDVLVCLLQDDLPALRLARHTGMIWPGLGAVFVLTALPLLSRIERARRRASLTVRAPDVSSAPGKPPGQAPLLRDLLVDD
jgi:hypothetical protein